MYVQDGIYDRFLEQFQQVMQKKTKKLGDPEKVGTEIGPVVDKAQYERILKKIKNRTLYSFVLYVLVHRQFLSFDAPSYASFSDE